MTAYKNMITQFCAVLLLSVEISGNHAAADVTALARFTVAEVR